MITRERVKAELRKLGLKGEKFKVKDIKKVIAYHLSVADVETILKEYSEGVDPKDVEWAIKTFEPLGTGNFENALKWFLNEKNPEEI